MKLGSNIGPVQRTSVVLACLLFSYAIISPVGNNFFQFVYALENEMSNINNNNSRNTNNNNNKFDFLPSSDTGEDKKNLRLSSSAISSPLKDKAVDDVFS